jgi:hypothetical protein
LRCVEEHRRRWGESSGAFELADFGFSVVVLHCSRMTACWLANYDIAQLDHSVISLHGNATTDTN